MGHLMTQLDGPFSTLDQIRSMKIERWGMNPLGNWSILSKILAPGTSGTWLFVTLTWINGPP
jgi:hypothetical protein